MSSAYKSEERGDLKAALNSYLSAKKVGTQYQKEELDRIIVDIRGEIKEKEEQKAKRYTDSDEFKLLFSALKAGDYEEFERLIVEQNFNISSYTWQKSSSGLDVKRGIFTYFQSLTDENKRRLFKLAIKHNYTPISGHEIQFIKKLEFKKKYIDHFKSSGLLYTEIESHCNGSKNWEILLYYFEKHPEDLNYQIKSERKRKYSHSCGKNGTDKILKQIKKELDL